VRIFAGTDLSCSLVRRACSVPSPSGQLSEIFPVLIRPVNKSAVFSA